MSAERDELIRLVRTIPDEQVSRLLADVRKQVPPNHVDTYAWFRDAAAEPSYWT